MSTLPYKYVVIIMEDQPDGAKVFGYDLRSNAQKHWDDARQGSCNVIMAEVMELHQGIHIHRTVERGRLIPALSIFLAAAALLCIIMRNSEVDR